MLMTLVVMHAAGGMTKGDGMLQTAGLAQMAVAQAVPYQPPQAPQMAMAAPQPAIAQVLQAPPPADPAAAPPVEAAPVAPVEAAPMAPPQAPMAPMAPGAPMAGPPQVPAAAPQQCAAGLTPCARPSCGAIGGCWELPAGATEYVCTCMTPPALAAPAPIIAGSPQWLEDPKNQVQGPPMEAAMGSLGMAQYESGKIALQLDRYLKASAEKATAQAELGKLILADVKALQPCQLVTKEDGTTMCADGSDPSKAGGSKGLLGLGFLGL